MKRRFALVMVIVTLLGFTGCRKVENTPPPSEDNSISDPSEDDGNTPDDSGEGEDISEGGLFSIIEELYEIKKPDLALGNIAVDLRDKDSVKYNTGLNDISKVQDIAVSEAMMGSQAYSLVLVQVKEVEDAKTVADEMLKGIDQRKWICVGADDLQIVGQGDLIMLFMVSSELKDTVTSQEMVDAFKDIRGGKLDIELKS